MRSAQGSRSPLTSCSSKKKRKKKKKKAITSGVVTVRESLHQHYALLASSAWQQIGERLQSLGIVDLASLVVRHAMMEEFSPNEGKRAPVTGTAIYLTPDQAGWMKTWELWTTIVAAVPGCIGVRGGWMVEPVESQPGYVVFVGWESVKIHDAYHHTKHFRQRASILREHNQGFREYGHIAFSQSVVRGQAKL